MTETQASRLLSSLFEHVEDDRPLSVLNIGPALPETVSFFSGYRCKLHVADLYSELPLRIPADGDDKGQADNGEETGLVHRLEEALGLPAGVQFDMVFLWDVLNFMSREAIAVLMDSLRPHLHPGSRAHCFAVHNSKTPVAENFHGIFDESHLSVRRRRQTPPDYQPHPQGELVTMLKFFQVDRSVLMPDRRIELLLNAQL